jgi:hypothetical protein
VIDLFQLSRFDFELSIEDALPCVEWITEDAVGKVSDVEIALNSELASSCGISVPCMANSQFKCAGNRIIYE